MLSSLFPPKSACQLIELSSHHNVSATLALAPNHFLYNFCLGPFQKPMSSLWKTEDFLAELLHLQKLCHLLPDEAQHGPMVTAFLLKAQAVQKWNSQDIVALLEKTQELNFSPGMSSQLKDGITKLCQNEGSHVKLVQAGQIVSNLAPYLTEEDGIQLANKRSQVRQLTVLAQRLREMGLTSLKEDTKSQAVALWLYSHVELQGLPEPQATTLHTMVAEFQAVFQSLPPNPSVPSSHTYPDNLAALPEDWKKKAYGSEEPAGRIVHLQLWKKKVPLRITAARLTTSKEAAKKTAPCQQNGVVPLLEQLLAKFPATQKAEQEVAFVDKGRKEEPASVAMPNSKPMAVPQEQQVVLPETKQPEQPKHKQQEEPKPEAIKKPLAAFEEEAYQAFTKKEAGKDHKKEQALKKKPASAKASALKRPAAATAKAKPSNQVAPAASKPSNHYQGLLGCIRCRGNKNGCASCIQPGFQGLRLPGRQAWLQWHQGHAKKQKTQK